MTLEYSCQEFRVGKTHTAWLFGSMSDVLADKSVKISMSLPDSLLQKIDRNVLDSKEDRSSWIRGAMRQKLENQTPTDPMSPSILVDLTKSLCGEIDAREMEAICGTSDQPRALRKLLKKFLEEHVHGLYYASRYME